MASEEHSLHWTVLKSLEYDFGGALSIKNEIVTIRACQDYVMEGLIKYNALNDTWTNWIRYPYTIGNLKKTTFSLDHGSNNNMLYTLATTSTDPDTYCWIKIDLHKESCEIFPYKRDTVHNTFGSVDTNSSLLAIDNTVHIFGGVCSPNHLIMNTRNGIVSDYRLLQQFFDINKFHKQYDLIQGYNGFGTIYLKSKKKILLLGGMLVLGRDSVDSVGVVPIVDIFEYSLITKQYKRSDIKLPKPMYDTGMCCTITTDERYVFIFNDKKFKFPKTGEDIYILDTHLMKFLQCYSQTPVILSGFQMPRTEKSCACIITDHYDPKISLLITGYCRRYNVSHEIIGLLTLFYCQEYIHFITRAGEHWKIKLQKILDHSKDLEI
eukprot:587682_1